MNNGLSPLPILVTIFWGLASAAAQRAPAIHSEFATAHPVVGESGMVATQEAHATRAAAAVLAGGGNAIDAAVTAGFALAVTLPRAGNIGGGGFMLVHLSEKNKQVAIDYRERAPNGAHRDMFLDHAGNPDARRSRSSHLASGVPGTVRGLALALENYGTISLSQALAPAIKLAADGFVVGEDLHHSLASYRDAFEVSHAAFAVFYGEDGEAPAIGSTLKQADLAKSLRAIARHGPDAFYCGSIAEKIVADMGANNGLITREDLAGYRPVIREPLRGSYRGWDIVSMPPPSSGGVHLTQMLNILERFPIGEFGHNSANTIHATTEAMRRAFADRSRYLGDPDFADIPTRSLVAKDYAARLARSIEPTRATPSREVSPGLGPLPDAESDETTHFSIIDRHGNAVANTYTLNLSYGSKHVVPGTGILLNNEMDDFSAKPGTPNAFGLIGGRRNAIEPGKRMLSSMTPTLLFDSSDGTVIATGSPGGSRIITTVLQMVCNIVDHRMNIAEATNAPRFHHQWFPDEIRVERGFSADTIELLEAKGHATRLGAAIGSTQSVQRTAGRFYGASDPRRRGSLTLGVSRD